MGVTDRQWHELWLADFVSRHEVSIRGHQELVEWGKMISNKELHLSRATTVHARLKRNVYYPRDDMWETMSHVSHK